MGTKQQESPQSLLTEAQNRLTHDSLNLNRQQHDVIAYASQILANQQHKEYSYLAQSSTVNTEPTSNFHSRPSTFELLRQSGALIDERIHRSRINMGMLYRAHTFLQVDRSQDWIEDTSTLDKAGSSTRKKDPVAQKPDAVPESVEDRNIAKFPASLIHSASAVPFPVKLYRISKDAEHQGSVKT